VTRPFRFAVQAYTCTTRTEWVELARKVEDLGFSTLHVADHYLGSGTMIEGTGHPVQTMSCVPAMTAAAMATTTLRVGSRLACVSYHEPTVLTAEMATIDVLSEGRLEIGLGAGWLVNEYAAIGIPLESAGRRIQKLRETAEFMTMAYSRDEEVDYRGDYIQAHGYVATPRPIQRPRPPLMIGGGAPKVLRLAGELADIVSVNFNNRSGVFGPDSISSSTDEETRKKIGWIREGAGERFDQLELETGVHFISVDGRSEITAEALMARTGMDREQLRNCPHAAVGSVHDVCEQLIRNREEYGFSYITVGKAYLDDFAPIVARLAGA
jgi:probable F420-dependent oxidoreductase